MNFFQNNKCIELRNDSENEISYYPSKFVKVIFKNCLAELSL